MIHFTLQERKVLLLVVFLLITGAVVSFYTKSRPGQDVFESDDTSCQDIKILDINLAQEQQLITLPGIGEKTAEDIVFYRQEHGPFKSVDELTKVNGIGPKKLEKIKGWIVVKESDV